MSLAPIVLFVYNRPWHTRQTLEALSKNDLAEKSELFVFADGAKINASYEEKAKIEEVRKIVNEKRWCGKVNLIISEKNKGISHFKEKHEMGLFEVKETLKIMTKSNLKSIFIDNCLKRQKGRGVYIGIKE